MVSLFRKPLIYMILLAVTSLAAAASSVHAEPSYAKYGRVAMQETANRYPDADIIDYRYEGHFAAAGSNSEERFRLWLRGAGTEFGVRVRVFVKADSGDVRDVQLEEIR